MNENLVTIGIDLIDPTEGNALAALAAYMTVPCSLTIVGVSACADTDDAGLTVDINDDGTAIISAIDAADKEACGQWKATGYGGTNTPVVVAAGSVLSFDVNNAAAATTVHIQIWALAGAVLS